MTDPKITCPSCASEIALTESLAGPLLDEHRREAAARQSAALAEQKSRIEVAAAEAAAARQAERLAELEEAARDRDAEMARMRDRDAARDAKLAAAQKAQADAIAREEALKDRERELEVTVQRQVREATEAARTKLRAEAETLAAERVRAAQEAQIVKLAEKDAQMAVLQRQIETLKRKAEQGSMQLQGEAAEVLLEDRLARAFPADEIVEVGKGARGADCLQRVAGPSGPAGAILWEAKRTQHWSPAWLPKLRADMREAGAEMAVLTSEARPDGCDSFAMVEGVWVAAPRYAVVLAAVLRDGLLRTCEARGVREGQATKTELLYDYLTGPKFKARLQATVEPFEKMQDALLKEKKHMQQQWALRDRQLENAMAAMMGMYGDIKGIAGAAVAEIEAFEPDMLED